MIALLGSHGYIGSAFAEELDRRGMPWKAVCHENPYWYDIANSELVINCAAFIPKTSVDLCDKFPAKTIRGNLLLPSNLVNLCQWAQIPLAHISTGYLWNDGVEHLENDPPQRAFDGYCGFYIGTKVMAEEEVRRYPKHFIWRLSLAFDERDNERNYLSKMASFDVIFDRDNCVSHRFDFVRACLDLWRIRSPFGTYNVMNHGSIKSTRIAELLRQAGIRRTDFKIDVGGHGDSKASISKLLSAGISMRSSEEAVLDSIKNWIPKK